MGTICVGLMHFHHLALTYIITLTEAGFEDMMTYIRFKYEDGHKRCGHVES